MPPARRPNLRDRMSEPARGREAVYGPPPIVDAQPSTDDRVPSTVDRWEDAHKRVTFYCPSDLLAAVEAEMARSGRSKSRVIVDALAGHLRGS